MKNKRILYCNGCGRQLRMEQGILREGAVQVEQSWGYFSGKDGEIHRFCLCEACYDKLRSTFVIPVEVEEQKEYL